MTELLANRYLIQARLGSGQQGAVFRAHDRLLDRHVAVKMMLDKDLSSAFGESLQREAMLLAKFENPHVVRVYDVVTDSKGLPAIVMELLEGEPLTRCLHTLSPAEVSDFARQICGAMQQAHHAGLLHRDLKPGNIMFVGRRTSRERFVILDMGIGKLNSRSNTDGASAAQTCAGAGTPLYMAPEQCHGDSGDARTDIYALGSILYEIYSGTAPFAHFKENLARLINAVLQESPRSLIQSVSRRPLSADLENLILRCLAKNPEHRPQTMSEVLQCFVAATEKPHVPTVTNDATGGPDLFETYIPPSDVTPAAFATEGAHPVRAVSNSASPASTNHSASSAEVAETPHGTAGRSWRMIVGLTGIIAIGIFTASRLMPAGTSNAPTNLEPGSKVSAKEVSVPVQDPDIPAAPESALIALLNEAGILPKLLHDSRLPESLKGIDIQQEQLTSELAGLILDDVLESRQGWIVSIDQKELALIQPVSGVNGTLVQLDVSNSEDRVELAMNAFCLENRLGAFVASYNMTFSDVQFAQLLKTQAQLEQLRVTDSGLGSSVPQVSRESLQRLRILDLSFNLNMSSECIVELAGASSVEELYLADTGIADEHLTDFSCSQLQIIDLTNTAVSNVGLMTLASKAGGKLKKLLVDATKIDDAAVDTLAEMKSLQQLTVGDRLSAAGLKRLKMLLPETEIISE